jgi:hypothetical protein
VTRTPTTVYAACATNNIANVYHNATSGVDYKFLGAYNDGQEYQIDSELQSDYDCCVKSFSYTDAAAWTWRPFQAGAGGIFSLRRSVAACDATDKNKISFYVVELDSESYPLFTGNTGCGKITSVDKKYVYGEK